MDGPTFTKNNEGCTLVAVKDTEGYEIGYGHNDGTVTEGQTWTQDQADLQFRIDYSVATKVAIQLLGAAYWNVLNEVRRAALVDMAYELGYQRLHGFGLMLQAIRNQDWNEAKVQCLSSIYAKEVPKRAARVADMLLSGVWPVTE